MTNTKQAPHGVIVPLITPIDQNEVVDEAAFRKVIQHVLDADVNGVFIGGSAGMGPLLTDTQWQSAMEIAKDQVGGDCHLLGGVMTTSTGRALEKIRVLEKIGYEYMVVTPTFYIGISTHDEMLCHFGDCRQATDMQMLAYNIPGCTHSVVPPETVVEMAKREWICAFKESSGDREYFEKVLKETSSYNLNMLQGDEPFMNWGLSLGAKGIVPVDANFEPKTFVTLLQAVQEGNTELAEKAQERVMHIREILLMHGDNWIAGIMYGMSRLGMGIGQPMKPLQPLSPQFKKAIDDLEPIDLK